METRQLTEMEVLDFLGAVDSGEINLTPKQSPQQIYAGDVGYRASNGWEVVVFNDCNEWDYLDSIWIDGSCVLNFDTIFETMPRVHEYRPTDATAWSRYGIPGYLHFRCEGCGKEVVGNIEVAACVCAPCGGTLEYPKHACACGRALFPPQQVGGYDEIAAGRCSVCKEDEELAEYAAAHP